MQWMNKVAKKFAKTASVAVTDSVKTEVKNSVVNALPALIGLGFVIIGLRVFKTSAIKLPTMPGIPTLSTMSVVTNNFFLGDSVGKEVVSNIIDSMKGGKIG